VENFLNQVLNIHGVCDVRQMVIHTAEPLVPVPSLVEVEIAVGKLKGYKFPGTDQILAKLNKERAETLHSEYTDVFILYEIGMNCHSSGRNLLLYQFVKRVIRLTVIIIKESPFY
jgi:hypothetical protein